MPGKGVGGSVAFNEQALELPTSIPALPLVT